MLAIEPAKRRVIKKGHMEWAKIKAGKNPIAMRAVEKYQADK